MRTTRIYTPIYIALLFAAIGCDKNYDQPATGQNDIVMFAASLAGTADGADSGNTPQTKGVLLNTGTTDISLQPGITEFKVAAYDGTTRFIPATNATNGYETVTYSNSKWATQTTYFWPGSVSKTFYAYANMPDNLNTNGGPSISCTSTGQVLTGFSINTDYTAQQDILMGYYSGNGKGSSSSAVERTAAIKFYHPLTAIRFKMGTETGITINSLKSIEIKDIYSSGKVSQSGTTFTWSDFGETTNVTMIPQSPSTTLAVNETTKLISNGRDETFILIPQNLEDQNVIINVVASIDGSEDKTFTGTLSTGAWEAGTVYTYELRIDKFKLQVVKVDEWKNNNGYNRSDYITRGAALSTGFVNKLAKNIAQAKNEPYTDDTALKREYIKTISFQTGMPLEDEAVIQRYDNEDDVIPGWSRRYEEGTDKQVVYLERIQEDYETYKRSEPIYSFCDAEGNCIICTTADVIYFPINCESLFEGCTELTSITGMTGGTTIPGFTSGTDLTDSLGNVRTDHTTSMNKMFNNCKKLTSLNLPFNTSEVTSMLYMFGNCTSLTALNVPFNTSKVNDMQYTFYNCKLQKIDGIENWSGESVMYASGMFYNCSKLSGKLDLSHFVTTNKLQRVNDMFCGCGNVTEIDLSGLITSGVTHMSSMFKDCEKLETITGISNWDVKAVTSTSRMFYNCSGLTNKFDLSSFETTSNLKNTKEMFSGCGNVTEIDLSKLDTSGVTDMSYMFDGCSKLKSIVGTSNWSGAAVTTTARMFHQCNELTALDLSYFITNTSLTNVEYMFNGCNNLSTLNISGLNTSNVTSFNRLFYECYALSSLYVGQGFTINSSPTNPPTIQYIVYHTSYDSTTGYQKCKVYCPDEIWNTTWKTIETGKTYTGATAQDTRWNKNMFTHITWTN